MPAREDNDEIKKRQKELRAEGVRMSFHATKRLLATEKRLAAAIEQKAPIEAQEDKAFAEKIELKLEQARPSFLSDGLGLRGPQNPITNLSIEGADGRGRDMQVRRGEERRITETSESSGGSALVDVDSLGNATPLLVEATNVRKVEGKSLKAGAGITFNTATAGEIQINAGEVTPGDGVYVESLGTGTPVLLDSSGVLVDTVEGYSLVSLDPAKLGIALNIVDGTVEFDPIYEFVESIDVNLVSIEVDNFAAILRDPPDAAGYSEHRAIAGGPGTKVEERDTDILITAMATSVGTGVEIYDGVSPSGDQPHRIRSLISSDASVTIEASGDDEIDLTVTDPNEILVNVGTGETLLVEPLEIGYVAGYEAFRSLEPNPEIGYGGIKIDRSLSGLSVWFSAKVTNLGGAEEIFKELDPTDGIRLRTLKSHVTEGGIILETDPVGSTDTITFKPRLTNLTEPGIGIGNIFKELDTTAGGEGIRLRSLKAGTNVTISQNALDVTIAATGGAGITQLIGDVTTPIDSSGNGVVASISAGAVGTPELADDSVTLAKLDGTGASTGDMFRFNGSAWVRVNYEELEVQIKLDDDTCVTKIGLFRDP